MNMDHFNKTLLFRLSAVVCLICFELTSISGGLPRLPMQSAPNTMEAQNGSTTSHEEKVELTHTLLRRAGRSVNHRMLHSFLQPQAPSARTDRHNGSNNRDRRGEVDAPLRC